MPRRPTKLTLGPNLVLPLEAATRRQAILATSGAGKSNAAVVMAEQMHAAGIPWVAVDPKGDWYGVRSNADGTGPGLDVPVLGGAHGDLPLDPTNGKIVARMIAERRLTCVLDVSEFDTRQDGFRFLADLAESLLRYNKTVLHLFLEEADEYLPQKAGEKGEQPRCLGAWGRLVRRGRQRGIGSTLISQRSAVVSKDVLYLAEALYAMRIAAKADRDTINDWVANKRVDLDVVGELPSLEDGEAFLISPGWLKRTERVRFARRTTFDSGATPEFGDDVVAATLAPVDLEVLRGELAETIERAAADDPERLRAQLRVAENAARVAEAKLPQLETQLGELNRRLVENPRKVEKRVAIWPTKLDVEATKAALGLALETLDASLDAFVEVRRHLTRGLEAATSASARQSSTNGPDWTEEVVIDPGGEPLRTVDVGDGGDPVSVAPAGSMTEVPRALGGPIREAASRGREAIRSDEAANLGDGAAAKIVVLLAQYPNGLSKGRIYPLAGYSKRATTVRNALTRLRGLGLIEGTGEIVQLTEAGRAATTHVAALPTGTALLDYWRERLGAGAARRIFDLLVARYPDGCHKEFVYGELGYSPDATTVRNALSKLRGYDLLDPTDGPYLRANPPLMGDHS